MYKGETIKVNVWYRSQQATSAAGETQRSNVACMPAVGPTFAALQHLLFPARTNVITFSDHIAAGLLLEAGGDSHSARYFDLSAFVGSNATPSPFDRNGHLTAACALTSSGAPVDRGAYFPGAR